MLSRFSPSKQKQFPTLFLATGLLLFIVIVMHVNAIDERTIHIDEGWGIRGSQQALSGRWHYFSGNGHGPTLFYIGAVIHGLLGDNILYFRTMTVITVMMTIFLILWGYRRVLIDPAVMFLLATFGLSSALTFFSAYFIHEPLLIFLTVCAFLSLERWIREKEQIFVVTFFLSAALMYATKETALFTYTAWALGGAALLPYARSYRKKLPSIEWQWIMMGIGLALVVYAVLFSSFFSNPGGILDSMRAPFDWYKRTQSFHHRPWSYFGTLLLLHEFPLVISGGLFAILLSIYKLWGPRHVFLAVWTVVVFVIYSAIRYKTPWCIPNIVLPLGLFATFGFSSVWMNYEKRGKTFLGLFLVILFASGFVITLQDNFGNPNREDDTSYAYLQSNESLDTFIDILRDLSYIYVGEGDMPLQVIGSGDELLHVLTGAYQRSYGAYKEGYPVYVNYQHSAEEMEQMLRGDGGRYVRAIFTYIQHINQIDLFVEESLWREYERSGIFIFPESLSGDVYDYRS